MLLLRSDHDVAEAIVSLRSNDPFVLITPALIYRLRHAPILRQLPATHNLSNVRRSSRVQTTKEVSPWRRCFAPTRWRMCEAATNFAVRGRPG